MKILCRKGFLVFLACFVVVSCMRQVIPESAQKKRKDDLISDEDRAELIRLELELVVRDKASIILSSENIEPYLVPTFDGVEIVVLTPEEIERKKLEEGSFMYFRFGPMKVRSPDSVYVYLDNLAAKGENKGGLTGQSGHCALWVRVDGKWLRSEPVLQWIE